MTNSSIPRNALQQHDCARVGKLLQRESAALADVGGARTAQTQTPQPSTDCVPEEPQQSATWGQVFGSWESLASDGNAAKLHCDIGGFPSAQTPAWPAAGAWARSAATATSAPAPVPATAARPTATNWAPGGTEGRDGRVSRLAESVPIPALKRHQTAKQGRAGNAGRGEAKQDKTRQGRAGQGTHSLLMPRTMPLRPAPTVPLATTAPAVGMRASVRTGERACIRAIHIGCRLHRRKAVPGSPRAGRSNEIGWDISGRSDEDVTAGQSRQGTRRVRAKCLSGNEKNTMCSRYAGKDAFFSR